MLARIILSIISRIYFVIKFDFIIYALYALYICIIYVYAYARKLDFMWQTI